MPAGTAWRFSVGGRRTAGDLYRNAGEEVQAVYGDARQKICRSGYAHCGYGADRTRDGREGDLDREGHAGIVRATGNTAVISFYIE